MTDKLLSVAKVAELWEAAQAEWTNSCGGPMEHQIFARMVAEEAIAAFLERTGQYVTNDASREAAIQEAVRLERERCADLCEHLSTRASDAGDCAAAIRARSEG